MPRYYMELIVRDERLTVPLLEGPVEKVVSHNVTCDNEEEARRSALNRAHDCGLLVRKFVRIRKKV